MTVPAWEHMSADQRRAKRLEHWRNAEVAFESPEAEANYRARVDRLISASTLGRPDRVPVVLSVGFWPTQLAGMTPYESMRDFVRAAQAWLDFALEFQPDSMSGARAYLMPASMFEKLDYRLFSWPGHGTRKEAGFQYNEKEWMPAEDYDALIDDPTGYLLRTYLPRTIGAFAGFSRLSSFLDMTTFASVSSHMAGWASQEMIESFKALGEAAHELEEWTRVVTPGLTRIQAAGFPPARGGMTVAPFDILGDTLRGMRGLATDMFRRPEKVLAACHRLVPLAIDWATKSPVPPAAPLIFIPLHKGADGFMSEEHFKTIYWPTLRKVIVGLIEQGFIPLLFAEGRYDSRLEIIQDVPKGATIWRFDQTDLALAKSTVGKVACISGNMPVSLLHAASPAEVADYTRKMIDAAGEGGGYILDLGASLDDGRPENLKAMVETAREYGVY
jgi:Uroporphyrinogen decarboxylase (URO-D)